MVPISKIFSFVELETNTGVSDSGYLSGIPDRDDIESSDLYRELIEGCGGSKYMEVTVSSYMYGEGESENASAEDLERIALQEDFTQRDDVEHLQTSEFTILRPDQGMTLGY